MIVNAKRTSFYFGETNENNKNEYEWTNQGIEVRGGLFIFFLLKSNNVTKTKIA